MMQLSHVNLGFLDRGWNRFRTALKQVCWLGVWLGLVVLLTACQGWGEISPGESDAETSGVVHLTLWQGVNPPPNRDVLQTLVDRFNQEHPTIQVESLYVGQADQQMPKILTAIVGNAAPDLLWFSPMLTGQLWELDAIQPLDDWLNHSPLKAEIDPALLSSMQFQNHLWSIPFGTNNVGLFYRPSLFQAAGITELPKTWDELKETARTLTRDTNGDGKIDQQGLLLSLGKGEWTVFTWLPFLWSAQGELTTSTSTGGAITPTLVTPGAIAALQFWQDLVKEGLAALSQPERGYELDRFLAGKVAMQLTGPWTLGQLESAQTDYAVMPIPTQAVPATANGGENLFLLKMSPAKTQAAQIFAEYVLSEAFQTQWALQTGYLPVNLKSRQSQDYQAFVAKTPAVKVFLDQAQFGRSRLITPGYNRISEAVGRAIEATLLQRSTPEAALKDSQARLDLIFKP
jgi:multiple sugar transport system substrate-binding protein